MQATQHGQDQSLLHLIASYALTQKQAEAKEALAKQQQMHPQVRLSNLWQAARLRRPDDIARLKEGLRLAGMPE